MRVKGVNVDGPYLTIAKQAEHNAKWVQRSKPKGPNKALASLKAMDKVSKLFEFGLSMSDLIRLRLDLTQMSKTAVTKISSRSLGFPHSRPQSSHLS